MAVTLTYDSVLSRVRVNADALTAVTAATVEKSTDQIRWSTVRGGADVALTGGSLLLPGTAGNYASTPDNAALDIVGDIDLRADVTLTSWVGATGTIIAKWLQAGNQRAYVLDFVGGFLRMVWSTTGADTVVHTSTAAPNTLVSATGRLAVRVTLDVNNGAGGHTSTFYTAPSMAGPWTQLGVPVVGAGTTSIFSSSAELSLGALDVGAASTFGQTVRYHAVEVRNGIVSTVVALPNFEFIPAGTTVFVDGAGRTWTLNGTASIPTRQFVAQVDDYEFAPGLTNYYRVSAIAPPAGLFLPGVSFSFASTPDNAALDITGDIDLRADVTLDDWTPVSNVSPITKWGGVQNSYLLGVNPTGNIIIAWSADGTATLSATSTVPVPAANGQRRAIRATLDVNNGAGGRTITFYTAGSIDGAWVQLGSPVVVGATTSIFAGTQQMEIGSHSGGTADLFRGTVHAAEVRNGIDGTAVANPNFAAQPMGTTGFTDAAGRVWSTAFARIINSVTANTTPTLTTAWLKSIARPFLNQQIEFGGDQLLIQRPPRGGVFNIVGRSLPVAVSDVRGSRRYAVVLRTETAEQAENLDTLFASGDVLFTHGSQCRVPSGVYWFVGMVEELEPVPEDPWRLTSAEVVEVAAPGPDVVGATSSWQTVINTYATWTDEIVAKASWSALMELVGDPSEVIVP